MALKARFLPETVVQTCLGAILTPKTPRLARRQFIKTGSGTNIGKVEGERLFLQALGSCEGAPGDAGWRVRNHTGGGGPGYAHFPGFSLSIASVNECRAKCCADAHCVSITLGPTEVPSVPTPNANISLVYKPQVCFESGLVAPFLYAAG